MTPEFSSRPVGKGSELSALFRHGACRLISPDRTLARIGPKLEACGITRCAEVTGLDEAFGVPTFCAIRPRALVLQTSNGKGLTREAAQVSALMEAIELHHAEFPDLSRLRFASEAELVAAGLRTLSPRVIDGSLSRHWRRNARLEWIEGRTLNSATAGSALSDSAIWVPAGAATFREPTWHRTTSNGLASGNHIVEAELHALYELLERDALAGLQVAGRLAVRERCAVIDPTSVTHHRIAPILEAVRQVGCKVVLLWVPARVARHVIWAALLDSRPFASVSTLNTGAGCHHDLDVALARALTEAIQSRLSFIHGGREDIVEKPAFSGSVSTETPAWRFFDGLVGNTPFATLRDTCPQFSDLGVARDDLLDRLGSAVVAQPIAVDLTRPELAIPVVKVLVPGLRFNPALS
ncbi:YcaO-like family protein [Sulfidibacter corallicola]|uniref:YcaO-like family protein n=1 Tax=Sulfidibacter corallicola TaxID=2818388 RepID=A0A8A4TGL8_SULCO|nr:YcaO-like family protein [Sulfidibacter corallicola]QTD48322.1 YcaO-like family protein [Sulfidibacter corallicola]